MSVALPALPFENAPAEQCFLHVFLSMGAEFGVDKDVFFSTLPLMAEQALASGSPNNNPRQVDKDEIVKLYETAWES